MKNEPKTDIFYYHVAHAEGTAPVCRPIRFVEVGFSKRQKHYGIDAYGKRWSAAVVYETRREAWRVYIERERAVLAQIKRENRLNEERIEHRIIFATEVYNGTKD